MIDLIEVFDRAEVGPLISETDYYMKRYVPKLTELGDVALHVVVGLGDQRPYFGAVEHFDQVDHVVLLKMRVRRWASRRRSRHQLGGQDDGIVGAAAPTVGADRVGPLLGGRAAAHDDLELAAGALILERVDDVPLADERRGEQSRDRDDVGVHLVGLVDELEEVDVDAEVVYLEPGGLEEELEDVLADRVKVALHGADHDRALLLLRAAGFLDLGLEHAHRRLEGQCGLHELGQEDVLALELLADDVEARQQALVDDVAGVDPLGQSLVDGLEDGVLILVDDRLLELCVR